MKRLLFFSLTAMIFAGCSKDKFQTIPQVTIKSFGPEEVRKGQLIELIATVTDKEGDVQDSALVVRKIFTGTTLFMRDTIRYGLASLAAPSKQEIELRVLFLYGEIRPEIAPIQNLQAVDRNLFYGIIVRDKAGNRSQYVESNKIVLKKL